jgi:hypothetical protein
MRFCSMGQDFLQAVSHVVVTRVVAGFPFTVNSIWHGSRGTVATWRRSGWLNDGWEAARLGRRFKALTDKEGAPLVGIYRGTSSALATHRKKQPPHFWL